MSSFFDPDGSGFDYKDQFKIVILGPYRPPSSKQRLLLLEEYLRQNGFSSACIVENFTNFRSKNNSETIAEYFSAKSLNCILTSDMAIFVFLRGVDVSGVTSELVSTIHEHGNRLGRVIVLFEGSINYFSSQIIGPIKTHYLLIDEFNNNGDLFEAAYGACLKISRQMYYDLRSRR